jgi:hypothetical protein
MRRFLINSCAAFSSTHVDPFNISG